MAIKTPISVTRMIPACLVLMALIVPQPAGRGGIPDMRPWHMWPGS